MIVRFLTQLNGDMNPKVYSLGAPLDGLRAIIGHELAHVLYLSKPKRLRRISLVRLGFKTFAARFERTADLEAISRGYARGLAQYREWLYRNIPADKIEGKRRDYFSPEEITAIHGILQERPEILNYWFDRVPLNLKDITA